MSDFTGGMSSYAQAERSESAQRHAADKAAYEQELALGRQDAVYQQQREDFAPYREMGVQGVTDFNAFRTDPNAYLNSPAYAWKQKQIGNAMNRQLAARGRSNSDYGVDALANAYGNLGAQEYEAAYNRMLDPIKIGQGAAGATGQAGIAMMGNYGNYANNQGNLDLMQGLNQAQFAQGMANGNQNFNNQMLSQASSLYGSAMGSGVMGAFGGGSGGRG